MLLLLQLLVLLLPKVMVQVVVVAELLLLLLHGIITHHKLLRQQVDADLVVRAGQLHQGPGATAHDEREIMPKHSSCTGSSLCLDKSSLIMRKHKTTKVGSPASMHSGR